MRVIIESPYAGDVERNKKYLAVCVNDSLNRKEYPFASHGFYTQYLDDENPDERKLGMCAGFEWMRAAEKVAVYVDFGISEGMMRGIEWANSYGITIEVREIGGIRKPW